MDKTKFLAALGDDAMRAAMQRIFEKAEQTGRFGETRFGEFCPEEIIDEINARKKFLDGVVVTFYGGFDEARRKMPAFSTAETPVSAFPVSAVKIACKNAENLTHRDYLGSLLSLGIAREKIGDILPDESGAVVIAQNEMTAFIVSSLRRVGGENVTAGIFNLDELSFSPQGFREIVSTVASTRLDAVTGLMLKTSRTKSAELVRAQKVFVNGALVTKGDLTLKEGDVITVRGKGKAVLDKIGNQSKKGRLFITVKKYI